MVEANDRLRQAREKAGFTSARAAALRHGWVPSTVVGLEDGRILVKKVQRSRTRGLYHLLSQTEDPILDVAIEWAARVKHMAPR